MSLASAVTIRLPISLGKLSRDQNSEIEENNRGGGQGLRFTIRDGCRDEYSKVQYGTRGHGSRTSFKSPDNIL